MLFAHAQDKTLSDPMDPAMDLMRLNGLIRRAVGLVKGLDIRLSDETYEFAVTSYVPGFKVLSITTIRSKGFFTKWGLAPF